MQWLVMNKFYFSFEVRSIGFSVGIGEQRKKINIKPKMFCSSKKKKELSFSEMRTVGKLVGMRTKS